MMERFGFAPQILRRLGEELVPHPDQGIVELVRNAYDADAKTCTIDLAEVCSGGGTIVVEDDGDGLTRDSIVDGWLVLGRSQKTRDVRTRGDRIPAGDKGLGRLAGLRLGRTAVLRTRPASEPGVEYEVSIDWDEFDRARVVEDVPIEVKSAKTSRCPGTTIELRDLRQEFGRSQVNRLARALVLLKDPFEHDEGFRPILLAPEFEDLERRVAESYFEDVEYRIVAKLDRNGSAKALVLDPAGDVRFAAEHAKFAARRDGETYSSSEARFEIWVFNLSGANFATRSSTLSEVRDWLRVVGGVHIYQHHLRVPPYGDTGYDWLAMNLRRARSPENRPSTNNSVGRVVLESDDELLVQKTDRTGFIESNAFGELRSFCQDALDWSAAELERVAETRRQTEREKAKRDRKEADTDADAVRSTLEGSDPAARAAFARYEKALERQLKSLKEDVLLYRTLGTVGTTSSAFAHESIKPASRIEQAVKLARKSGQKQFGEAFNAAVGRQLNAIEKAASALGKWAQMPLRLLQRDKRRSRRVDVRVAVEDVLELLEPFLADAKIEIERSLPRAEVPVFAPPAAIESIVANLLVNALRAVVESGRRPRRIRVSLSVDDQPHFATLAVADSGNGIRGIGRDEVWLPGRTSHSEGTGLGLTIVRDSATDMGGSAALSETSDLGGAEFLVTLPIQEQA